MPSKELLLRELTKLSIAYPAAKRGSDEVEVLADMWVEDLEGVSDEELRTAIKQVRQNSAYFPTSAQVLRHVEKARRQPVKHSGALELTQRPRRLSDEERERGKRKVQEIRQKVAANSRLQ